MTDVILTSPFFGLTLTAAAWCAGCWLQKKTGLLLCNPLLIAVALIIAVLALLDIPYAAYSAGGDFIKLMLGPVTAVLALNIYNQRAILKEHFLPVLAGCLVGSLTSVGSILALCRVFRVEEALTASLLPKSVTTAIAMGIAESHGGVAGIAAAGGRSGGLRGLAAAGGKGQDHHQCQGKRKNLFHVNHPLLFRFFLPVSSPPEAKRKTGMYFTAVFI